LIDLLSQPEKAHALATSGKRIVEREFSFRRYLFDMLKLAETSIKRVSVIVPNYNYERYIAERVKTIVNQDYPIYEIIILDDKSSDNSVPVISEMISELNIDCQLIVNESNSGSPFFQWLKGVELAQGDYIWIAEADDLSEPGFLQEVMKFFEDSSIVMSYCQSVQLGEEGRILCNDYFDYLRDVSSEKWSNTYINEGLDEIRNFLAIKNTIPNVSSAVFERNSLASALRENIDEIKQYCVAGDWLTYIYVLDQGKIAYSPKAYNLHRRHQNSVTVCNFNQMQLEEILAIQQMVRQKFCIESDIVKKAHKYAQRLYEQFELCSPNAPMVSKHPRLSTYIER
jgi:glycosyltransferase involved in cell wall biosynthesis